MHDNEWISSLPDAVQSLIARIHGDLNAELQKAIEQCNSPIEQQFAAGLAYHLYGKEDEVCFYSQEEVHAGGHDYQVDFILSIYDMIFEGDKPVYDWETRLAVECDGWDWHSSKKQINYDNRRDQDLLIYHDLPTIRFTGSEIFADPIATAGRALLTLRHLNEHRRESNLLLLKGYKLIPGGKDNVQKNG